MNETRDEKARDRQVERQRECHHTVLIIQGFATKRCLDCGQIFAVKQNMNKIYAN